MHTTNPETSTSTNRHTCLNCNSEFEGNFCPECGQNAQTKRLQYISILQSFYEALLNGDNRFLHTLKMLTLHPGQLAKDYVLGRRQSYYHPLSMLVFLAATYTIILSVLPDDISEMTTRAVGTDIPDDGPRMLAAALKSFSQLIQNRVYLGLMGCAIFAWPHAWIFRNYKLERPDGQLLRLNVTEHFFLLLYRSCASLLCSIIELPLLFITPIRPMISFFSLGVPFALLIIAYSKLYGINWRHCTRIVIMATLLGIAGIVLLILTFTGLWGGIVNVITKRL